MVDAAFLIVPLERIDTGDDWASLSRQARLDRRRDLVRFLTEAIREWLAGMDVDELAGVGGWTVRTRASESRKSIVEKLQGLPVEVAPNDRFEAISDL